ncbi:MAG TPA: sulfotransferase domain-containing protein [Patescibacteria group bacterium]|nr:sulfotransferase domain-containing protein [Patescibacteria group bacterium]
MNKPNCVIIGAAKAGTTSLYFYLSEHPDVFLPQQLKEINYFSGANKRIKTESDYLALFNDSGTYKVRMDISTSYLYDFDTPQKIKQMLGEQVKIIAFLRNPVNASYSLWKQIRHYGHETLSFEDALQEERKRMTNSANVLKDWPPNYYYTDRYKYAPQLQRYFDVFSKDNIKVYIFEEFFSDLNGNWRDLCTFLGVDASFTPKRLGSIHNVGATGVKSTLIRDLIIKPFWWKKFFTWIIPARIKNRFKLKIDDWNKVRNGESEKPDNRTQELLQRIFFDDVRSLEALLGRSLDKIWF